MGTWDSSRSVGCFLGYSAWFWAGVLAFIIGGIIIPVYLATAGSDSIKQIPLFVGTYCSTLAAVLSTLHILEHLSCFADPDCQMKVVRVIFMAPLYAVTSCVGLWHPSVGPKLDLLRDAYEAYAIYAFFSLMIAQCGGYDTIYRSLMVEQRPPVAHIWPFASMEPMRVTPRFVQRCRLSLFQFMVIKPLTTLIALALDGTDAMGKVLEVRKAAFWIMITYNITLTVALYGLIYLYNGLREFLEGKNALLKFLSFKAVVFLSYWQGLVITVLVAIGWMPTYKGSLWATDEEAHEGLQRLLICIEMLLVSVAHKWCFPAAEFTKNAALVDDWSQVSVTTTTDAAAIEEMAPSAVAAGNDDDDDSNDNSDGMSILNRGSPAGAAAAFPSLRPRPKNVTFVPPARREIWANLKMTLQQPDVVADVRDICRGA